MSFSALLVGCSGEGNTDQSASAVTAPSDGHSPSAPDVTTVANEPDPNYQVPATVAELEQVILAYGECIVAQVPEVGLGIKFDLDTGATSASIITPVDGTAPDDAQQRNLDRADVASNDCNARTNFERSLFDFAEQNPTPREIEAARVSEVVECVRAVDTQAADRIVQIQPEAVSDIDAIGAAEGGDASIVEVIVRCVDLAQGGEWLIFGDVTLQDFSDE